MVKKDKTRSNGKVKVKRAPELPARGEYEFGSKENIEIAEAYWAHLVDLHSLEDNDSFQAVLEFAKWSRDNIGWKGFGRIMTKGTAAR